jgi:hypothetical protein
VYPTCRRLLLDLSVLSGGSLRLSYSLVPSLVMAEGFCQYFELLSKYEVGLLMPF